jgi:transmembrane sensor
LLFCWVLPDIILAFRNKVTEVYSEIISTPNQVINEYILPDGSVVALNSNSKLVFPKQFKGDTREVTIEGEAFFDVKPNAEKPFIINAGNAQVKVVGTSFNVCAYPETETVEVVVETGKVQVISKNNELTARLNEVFLVPGEKGTLFNKSSAFWKNRKIKIRITLPGKHAILFSTKLR